MSKFEIFNLSFGDNYNVKKVIKLISESFGRKKFKYKLAKGTPGDSFGFNASGKKLKKIFKFKSYKRLSAGLKIYCEWIKKFLIKVRLKGIIL